MSPVCPLRSVLVFSRVPTCLAPPCLCSVRCDPGIFAESPLSVCNQLKIGRRVRARGPPVSLGDENLQGIRDYGEAFGCVATQLAVEVYREAGSVRIRTCLVRQ